MNSAHWEKLRKNLSYLQREVEVNELVPYLIEKGVVEICARSEIDSLPSNSVRIERLLSMLKSSPPEKNAYRCFLDALRSCEFEFYRQVADDIDATATESDTSVHAKVDPSHYENEVRQVLNESFTDKRGQTTSLKEIKSVLGRKKVFKTTPWSDEELTNFVCSHFAGVDIYEEPGFLTGRKNVFFKHLSKLGPKQENQASPAALTNEAGTGEPVDVSKLSPPELKHFLSNEVGKEQVKMSTTPLSEMEKEEISGNIFLDMNENDLEKVMPSSTFGLRRVLKNIIEKCKQKHVPGCSKIERFRAFDSEVTPSTCYIQGQKVDFKVQTRGKKLAPVRNFHQPECETDEELKHYIIIHSAVFVAACINQRQNGTIHFGISSPEASSSSGLITGLQLSPEDFEDRLLVTFFPSQHHLIKSAVRNAKFIPVVKDEKYSSLFPPRYVIEIDVVPGNTLREDQQYVKINAKDFPHPWKVDQSQEPVFVLEGGKPVILPPDDVRFNLKLPSSTICQRRQEEYDQYQRSYSDRLMQLRNHLTGGSKRMEDDVYKIVFLSSICHTSQKLHSLDFIQSLQPEVVFDFDPQSYEEGIFKAVEDQEEVLKILTVDEFDGKRRTKKEIDSLKKELNENSHTHWMFCNGCKESEKMDAGHWNLERRPAFRKSFYHYLQNCHKDRVLIIMCLFSHSDIFVEACEEILLELPHQWILLSGELSDAEKWQKILTDRNKVFRNDLDDRCISGLPWEQVNRGITTWCSKDDNAAECQVPHSSGLPVSVEKKKINEWSDIDVLSSSDPRFPDDKTLKVKQKEAEENFYVGGQVQWLNFYSGHVCRRKIHEELFRMVTQSLEGCNVEYENEVLPVYLFHEPGAGGSTSAREILWSLRTIYRCCVVKRFTGQTFSQLVELFKLKDDSPKPLLILFDNEDEDELTQVVLGLEIYLKESDMCCPTFCVLLVCYRTVFVPIKKRNLQMVKLKQFLDKDELAWFNKTYKDLKSRFDDPKSLISFNILKENFDKTYIQNTVKEFVKDVKDRSEEVILKYVSLINTFDLQFNTIPVSCFDDILKSQGHSSPRPSFSAITKGGRKTSWEANVSQSFRVLLNLNEQKKKARKTVRVFNKLTAEQILIACKAKSGESEGDLVLSLLTEDIFKSDVKEMKKLRDILTNMVKHRALHTDGVRKDKYSPLILSVWKKEGTVKVKKIMTTLYSLNEDPYTAQQIARFHLTCKEYEEAEYFANEAVTNVQWNAALWNTYAQVYRVQLSEKIQLRGSLSWGQQYTESEMKELIALCRKSTELFQLEQSKSLSMTGQKYGPNDESGFLGELESIELIINALWKCKCFESEGEAKEITHQYLVNARYIDERLGFLSVEERSFLKSLLTNSKEAMKVLDDKYLQLREDIVVNPLSVLGHDNRKKLVEFKAFFNIFFGEKSERIPSNLSDEDKCLYRSRIVIGKGANSLSDVLQLKSNQKMKDLKKCYSWLLTNVKSQFVTLPDLERIIDVVTVVKLDDGPILDGLKFPDMIRWTKQLYEMSWKEDVHPRLVAFMYFALYNFPTEERLKCKSLAPAPDLKKVLDSWIETFLSTKHKRYYNYITHKMTTLFFLGNGAPLRDIVYSKNIGPKFDENSINFAWDSPILCKILRPLEGTLLPGGEYIIFSYTRAGQNFEIKIKTSYKVVKSILWRHKIYFYLGFSFSGLKAYGATHENPLKNN